MMNQPCLQVRVVQAQLLNGLIRQFRLRAQDGGTLPPFSAGAHVKVQVRLADGTSAWRHYSLVDFESTEFAATPAEYVIAVRKEEAGRGGSRFMHDVVREGDLLLIEAPCNQFPLKEHAGPVLLVAGGIGVTPLTAMAAHRRRAGLPVRMVYAGRDRASMAYLTELHTLLGDRLALHIDSESSGPLDVDALLDACSQDEQLYVCGPSAMLTAVLKAAEDRGWDRERVSFETFSAPATDDNATSFTVELAQSGRTLKVGPDQTILECLEQAGCDPISDCRRGECGVCAVPVLSGEIDHRDYVLSNAERAAGNVIQVCVSRARGAHLVLDL